jgi:hypothetical protein
MATVEAAKPTRIQRWAGLGGILYVALLIGGSVLAFDATPNGDDPPAKFVSYFGDSGNRDQIGIGWILVVLGVFFFIWFLSALRQVLGSIDGDGFLTTLATVGGTVYAALVLAGISVWMGIATMSDDTFNHQVYPGLIHAGNDVSYVIYTSGGIGAGTMMIAASLAASRGALIPRWAGVVGIVFGVLALGSIAFFPQALVGIWILVAAVVVFRASGRPVGGPPAPATPAAPAAPAA